jgi:hypothetical protein
MAALTASIVAPKYGFLAGVLALFALLAVVFVVQTLLHHWRAAGRRQSARPADTGTGHLALIAATCSAGAQEAMKVIKAGELMQCLHDKPPVDAGGLVTITAKRACFSSECRLDADWHR